MFQSLLSLLNAGFAGLALLLFVVFRGMIPVLAEHFGVFSNPNDKAPPRLFFGVAGMLFAVSALMASGCAGPVTKAQSVSPVLAAAEKERQEQIAFDTRWTRSERLFNLSFPIMRAAAPICGKHTRYLAGFQYMSLLDFAPEFRKLAIKRYQLGDPWQAFFVNKDSPAEQAGLKPGDVFVSADGQNFPSGKDTRKKWRKIYHSAVEDGEVDLVISRDGRLMTLHIKPVKTCNYYALLKQDDSVNAFADGEKIHITTGMMRFAETDQELALVIAHELAHNALRHIDKQKQNRLGGAVADGVLSGLACAFGGICGLQTGMADAAARAFSQGFEAEADYVGLYMMARAGMEIEGAANFWRRMAVEHPASIESSHTATHPSTPERFVALEKTIEEIKMKQAQGLDLMPDLRE